MKHYILIGTLTAVAFSSMSEARGVQQFGITSHADPLQDCGLRSRSYDEAFPGVMQTNRTKSGCEVSVPKFVFEQRFEYCALSSVKETNDDRYTWEHDYGSQCSFEFIGDEAVFKAVRGFGFSDESTSMLYCGFTCIEASEPPAGEDLMLIKSTPLED